MRFQRSLYDKTSGATKPLDSKIATLEFSYKPNLKMEEKYRIENPLGFQVTSYRVDNDYAAAPPLESDVLSVMQDFAVLASPRAAQDDTSSAGLSVSAIPADGAAAPDTGEAAAPAVPTSQPVAPANGVDAR